MASEHNHAREPLLRRLQEQLRDQMNTVADAVCTGTCPDHATYQWQTGKINGLAMAERLLLDIDEMLNEDDD
jgi:hypothetical protein